MGGALSVHVVSYTVRNLWVNFLVQVRRSCTGVSVGSFLAGGSIRKEEPPRKKTAYSKL